MRFFSHMVANFYKVIFKKFVYSFTRVPAASGSEENLRPPTLRVAGQPHQINCLPSAHKPPPGLIPNKHLTKMTNTNQKQGFMVGQACISF